MSNPSGAVGVVVGHGGMAQGLVDATRRITGDAADSLRPLSNEGKGPDELRSELDALVGDGTAVVFVDLMAGSCGMAALACCRNSTKRVMISGVNLPILLDFVFHRTLPLEELASRLVDTGRTSISPVPGT